MKFNINDYKGKYVMHCKTKDEAKNFCAYLDSVGKRWRNGSRYTDNTCYKHYEEDTVYGFNEGMFDDIRCSKADGYTILEWEDFMNNTFTKSDLRTGDVILRRDGTTEIYNGELGMFITKDGWNDLAHERNDLTDSISSEFDIVAVRRPRNKFDCVFDAFVKERGELVYERKEVEEMTLAEVCKLLGKEIKIIQ